MVSRATPDERHLGQAIRELREARGITGERLAREAEVDIAHVNRAENHGRNLTLQTVVRLAGALGVTASELLRHAEEVAEREERTAETERR
jgi:transcriptional regulator with XRE-family HTH domain